MTHKPFKVGTYVDFGPPSISNAPIGTLYFDKHTNKTWMLNSQRKWVHMITPLMWAEYGISSTEAIQVFDNLGKAIVTLEQQTEPHNIVSIPTNIELAPGKVYDLPKNHNCRNCGAPVYRSKCDYCGTCY
jgi:hypothetical protein